MLHQQQQHAAALMSSMPRKWRAPATKKLQHTTENNCFWY
jgi:hypothetical protein